MTTRWLTTAILCGLNVCLVSTAAGQLPGAERRLIRIGFGGGVSVPTSHAADALKSGINGQAFLLLDPGLGAPLRFNLGYQKFDFKDAFLPGSETGESQMLSGVAGLNISLLRSGPLRPYITAGVGAFNLKETLEAASGETSTSDLRFGIDGGGGFTLKLGRLEAFVEGRIQNVYTEEGAIDTKRIRAIPVTFGIVF
jgi:hypothetical protein